MPSLSELLGDELVHRDGRTESTSSALADADFVGLYFSAHWCPPCRGFTPILGAWAAKHGAAKRFKVVFASNDESEDAFKSYFASHAWDLALPFKSKMAAKLGSSLKVKGIPTLAIFDREGALVTIKGREGIAGDADGAAFPYRPKGVWDLLGEVPALVDRAGAATAVAEFRAAADVVGVYFSAHWCGPCRSFTPALAKFYEATRAAAGKPTLDIVFVSSDRDEASFKAYLAEMPWKALPFAARATKERLSELFEVEGIPTLVFVRRDGTVLSADGRSKVMAAPDAFPWPPQAVDPLSAATEYINDVPTMVLFTDKMTDAAAEAAAVAAFTAVAHEFFVDGKPSDALRFAVAGGDDEATDSVRKFLGRAHVADKDGPTAARVTIVNVPGREKALLAGGALGVPGEAALRELAHAFVAGTAATLSVSS